MTENCLGLVVICLTESNWLYMMDRALRCSLQHGVPQGSIHGPLMFTVLLDDIDTNLKLCDMILYADDIVMFHAGRTRTGIENSFSSELEQIASWFNGNNLVINLKKSKTECVLYGTHQKISSVS